MVKYIASSASKWPGNEIFFLSANDQHKISGAHFPRKYLTLLPLLSVVYSFSVVGSQRENKNTDVNCFVHTILPSETCDLPEYATKGTTLMRGSMIREGSTADTSNVTIFFRVKHTAVDFAPMGKSAQNMEMKGLVDYLEQIKVMEQSDFVNFVKRTFTAESVYGRVQLLLRCCLFLYSHGNVS